ncbi:hypothetical protein OHC33_007235 [Knufia fluminis]|uniref:Uncharacterized protein n=1 Tax=Knufia fluminis TaxID=191047 RepID=A0AAN8I2M6_9EURO|nr:hypothetical protein OHC33_007235 [Knufia fluminis]
MNKNSVRDRFFWSDTVYDPLGTPATATIGVIERRKTDHTRHDDLRIARKDLVSKLSQQAREMGWSERSWDAFHRLNNIEGVELETVAEIDGTARADITVSVPDIDAMLAEDAIEMEDILVEDLIDIDDDDGNPVTDTAQCLTQQIEAQDTQGGAASATDLTADQRRVHILAQVVTMRQNVQSRHFEDSAERDKILHELAGIEHRYGPYSTTGRHA